MKQLKQWTLAALLALAGTAGAGAQQAAGISYVYDDDTYESTKNATILATLNGQTVKLCISGRTLYRDGDWNTLCLPFALTATQLADSQCPLCGADIRQLSSASFADGTLTLSFTTATAIEAGRPYIVKWTAQSDNIENPVFQSVTISSAAPTATAFGDVISMQGSYSPIPLTSGDTKTLYLGSGSTLYYPTKSYDIGAFRATFTLLGDLTAGTPSSAAAVRAFVLDFGEATSIHNSQFIIHNDAGTWYSLDGRRLAAPPTAPGIYVNNGKKIIIK